MVDIYRYIQIGAAPEQKRQMVMANRLELQCWLTWLRDYAVDVAAIAAIVVVVVTVDLLSNWFYKYFALIWKPQRSDEEVRPYTI